METYRKTTPQAKTKNIRMPEATTGETKYDNLAAGFQKQQAQYEAQAGASIQRGLQSLTQVTNAVAEVATVEAEQNAIVKGKERAQLDFAEIQKLKKTRDEAAIAIDGTTEGTVERELLVEQTAKIDTRMKELLNKRSQFNISERVRADELNEIYVNQVSIDTKNTIGLLYNKFESNPEMFEVEANKLLAQADGVPLQFRETIKNNIRNDISVQKSRAEENLKKKHANTLQATRIQSLTSLNNEVTQLAREGKNTVPHLDKIKSILTKQLNEETITLEQYNTYSNHLGKDIVKQKAFGAADTIAESKMTDTQKLKAMLQNAEAFNDTLQPLLSADEKSSLYNDLKRKAGLYQTKIKTQIATQKKIDTTKFNKILARAKTGKTIGKNDMAEFKTLSLRLGRADELNAATLVYENVRRFQASTPLSQKNYLEQYKIQIDLTEEAGGSTFEMRTVYEMLQKQGAENAAAIESDVIGYTMNNPQKFGGTPYQPKSLDLANSLITADEKGYPDFTQFTSAVTNELKGRLDNKDNFTAHMGKFDIMSPKEVANLNRKYNEMSVNDKGNFLKSLNASIGATQSNAVFSKLWKDKPDSASIAGIFFSKGNETVANDILLGASLRQSGEIKLDSSQRTELEEKIYAKMAASTYLVDPKHLNMYKRAIADHYLGNNVQANTLDTGSIDDSFEQITNGVTKYNGKPLLAPEIGKDDDDIQDWLKYMGSNNMVLEKKYGEKAPDGYNSWFDFKQELSNVEGDFWGKGTFDVKTAGGSKYVLMKEGNVVKQNGEPIVFDWFNDNELDDKGGRIPWYQGQ